MAVTVKYGGLLNGPLLVTPSGRITPRPAQELMHPEKGSPENVFSSLLQSGLEREIRTQEQQRVVGEVRLRVNELLDLMDNLHIPEGDNLGVVKTAVSPKPKSLRLSAGQEATADAVHTLDVKWPSAGGQVLGSLENPVAEVPLEAGTYEFQMYIDGEARDVSVGVHPDGRTDTNESLLKRVARTINMYDPRIKAEVVSGFTDANDPTPNSRPLNRVVRLQVSSVEEGQGPDFYFSEETPGLVEHFKLSAGIPARPARVEQGGVTTDRPDDSLSLDGGQVTGAALDTTAGPVNVPVKKGGDVITGELVQVITKYNELVSYLDAQSDVLRDSLKDRVVRPLEERAREMPQVGLKATAKGRLNLDGTFAGKLKSDFAQARETLISGEDAWIPALRNKLVQIQDLSAQEMSLELRPATASQQSRWAWDLLHEVTDSIIGGYY